MREVPLNNHVDGTATSSGNSNRLSIDINGAHTRRRSTSAERTKFKQITPSIDPERIRAE